MLYLSFKFARKFKFCVSPLVKRYPGLQQIWKPQKCKKLPTYSDQREDQQIRISELLENNNGSCGSEVSLYEPIVFSFLIIYNITSKNYKKGCKEFPILTLLCTKCIQFCLLFRNNTTNFQSKSQSKLFGISVFNKICIKPTLFVHILIKFLVTNSMLLNYNSFNRINSKRRDQNNVSIFVIIFFFIL